MKRLTSRRLAILAKLRPRLTYANVTATVAVFLALGGGSYAAISITGKNVKDSSLTGKDIKNSSLTTSDVKNSSLLAADFKSGQLPAGARGAQGPAGPQGLRGQDGQDGFGVLEYPTHVDVLATGNNEELDAICPSGTFPTGGAAAAIDDTTGDDVGDRVIQSQFLVFDSSGRPAGYGADFNNSTGSDVDTQVEGFCANADQVPVTPAASQHTLHR